jgi:hypothetical protein
VFLTTATNIAQADEVDTPPGVNSTTLGVDYGPGEGQSLTFDRINTLDDQDERFFSSFRFTALEDTDFLTFDDEESSGNLANFDNALSPGDIDDGQNDDWRLRLINPAAPLRGFGVELRDSNNTSGEFLRLYNANGALVHQIAMDNLGDVGVDYFLGVVSDEPFTEMRYDEDSGGDDIAVADFRFVRLNSPPTAVDVFASVRVNTVQNTQSAKVILEGADELSTQLTYSVVIGPSNGTLRDPGNGDAEVISGTIAGQALSYTPDDNFIGSDVFSYRVSDGNSNSDIKLATVDVFDSYRLQALPIGVDIDGEAAGDESGYSVSMSSDGQSVAIGARFNDGENGDFSGHVRIYDWNGSAWVQRGSDIDGEAANDWSGTAVSLSGDAQTVAIGAGENADNGTDAGHVRIYRWDGQDWTQRGGDIDGEAALDKSGRSVSLSSDGLTVAIGALLNDPNGSDVNDGHVRVYYWNGSSWAQRGADIDGDGDGAAQAGASVALSGDGLTVAVGAPGSAVDLVGNMVGRVRIYDWSGTSWSLRGSDIVGEARFDESGRAVSLSSDGQVVAIGAARNSGSNGTRAGHVRIYGWDGTDWEQLGDDIEGDAPEDQLGTAVSLSSDGHTVAIGSPNNAGNGQFSGHVRVYGWNGASWTQLVADIEGEAPSDLSGSSVSVSSDGRRVAIGAPENSARAGYVRVYELTQPSTAAGSGVDFSFDPFDPAPTAVDVFVATPVNTNQNPQSALVILEGSDEANASLTYTVISGVANGTLRDPGNGDAEVINGTIAGQTLRYTPDLNVTGTDVFAYRVSDGNSNSEIRIATVDVFESYRQRDVQIGDDIDGAAADDQSGRSVSLSSDGRTVAIGAGNDDNGDRAGHVRVYRWNGTNWSQLGADIDGEAAGDESGWSVSLSSDGQTVAIGAILNGDNGDRAGQVRIYHWSGTHWVQRGADIDGEAQGDQSGWSVVLSSDGETVAIGAFLNDGNGSNSGHVRIYWWDGADWIQRGADIDGEAAGDASAYAVALSSDGQSVAIGARSNAGNGGGSGHVRIYQWDGTAWDQRGADIDGEAAGDQSGWSVALSSDAQTVAIGAPRNSGGNGASRGHVRVYQWDGTAWIQRGADIDGEANGDESGGAVALSSDGQTVAIGASRASGSNGIVSGHVRIYQWDGADWTQRGADIDGEESGDESGYAVALSSDGQTVAIGARSNDGNGVQFGQSGHVRIFDLTLSSDEDDDGDGISNGADQCPDTPDRDIGTVNAQGCASTEIDSDNDGVNDAFDAFPGDPSETVDTDGDGLGDNREIELGTRPDNPDTDGDGFTDLEEVEAESDPLSADDIPAFNGLNIPLIKAAIDRT